MAARASLLPDDVSVDVESGGREALSARSLSVTVTWPHRHITAVLVVAM